jgi:hypothetical protein
VAIFMLKKCLYILIVLLIISSIFDPEDLILKLKVPLFVSVWALFLLIRVSSNKETKLSNPLFFYLLIFIFIIPSISILNFILSNGYLNYEYGWFSLKALFFLTLLAILYVEKIEILESVNTILTILSCTILFVFILMLIGYDIFSIRFIDIANNYGLIQKADYRTYGEAKSFYIYFVTAPLLVLPVSYYCYKFCTSQGMNRLKYLLITLINTTAFFLTGSRNSIVISVISPLMVIIYCSKKKLFPLLLACMIAVILFYNYQDSIIYMFNINNEANYERIEILNDYLKVFDNTKNLLLGQGFGSSFYLSKYGEESWIAELTYLEIIRRYGLILGSLCMGMLMYPIIKYKRYYNAPYLIIAYLCYLLMSLTNPFIFSSSGMIMLCIVLYPAFVVQDQYCPRGNESAVRYRKTRKLLSAFLKPINSSH